MQSAHESIVDLISAFYSAFANDSGPAPVDNLYDVCLSEALIANATNEVPAVYTLREFIEPRRELLQSGTLVDFREYEVAGNTELSGRIAYRMSRYEKTWNEGGTPRRGAGTKLFSFVLTPRGWKIASVLWHDDPSVT